MQTMQQQDEMFLKVNLYNNHLDGKIKPKKHFS